MKHRNLDPAELLSACLHARPPPAPGFVITSLAEVLQSRTFELKKQSK